MQLRITDERVKRDIEFLRGEELSHTAETMNALLADRTKMLARIADLESDAKLSRELDWTETICDRLNMIARENGLPECLDGPNGSKLAETLHGRFGSMLVEIERLRAALNEIKGFIDGCGCSMPCRCWGNAEINKETIFQMANLARTALEATNAKP